MSQLGVSLDSRSIVPHFYSDGGSKVYMLLDFCHLMKLVRNCFAKQGGFLDPTGRKIEWRYITELVKLQQEEGLHLGNKLTKTHILFHNSKMSVRLATQLLSSSVADSIEYCADYLKLPQFQVRNQGFLIILYLNSVNET